MKKFIKPYVVYILLILIFGSILVPQEIETGYIGSEGLRKVSITMTIAPLWTQHFTVSDLNGLSLDEYEKQTISHYSHVLILSLLTLAFMAYKYNHASAMQYSKKNPT